MKIKPATKNIYLLIGGGCHTGQAKDKLSAEIENWLAQKQIKMARILFIPFAKDKIDWKKTIQKYNASIFAKLLKEKKLSTSVATPNPATLKKQLVDSDILFFNGGSELNLKKFFTKKMFPRTGKLIIGVSAGVNFLAMSYFSNDRQTVEPGIEILPIKTICHFSPQKHNAVLALSDKKPYPIIPINEDDYTTLIF